MKNKQFFETNQQKNEFVKNVKKISKQINKEDRKTIRYFLEKLSQNTITELQFAQLIFLLNKYQLNDVVPHNIYKQLFPTFETSEIKETLLKHLDKELENIKNTPDNILKKTAYEELKTFINYIENKNNKSLLEFAKKELKLMNYVHKSKNEYFFNKQVFLDNLIEKLKLAMIQEQKNTLELSN